jgi:galactose-1-phosphate uridylyltransferase
MSELTCMIEGCQAKAYAPAGTQSVCKEHFISFLTWRRRKGPQMFTKYAAMTMEERNAIVTEWQKTVAVVDTPTTPAPKV